MDTAVDGTTLVFRDARVGDVAAIVALVESAYRGDASRAGWTTEADLLDGQRIDAVGVAEIVVRRGSRVLLASTNGDLLACCHLEKHGDGCYFGMFSVKPTMQAAGVGKRTLAEAERLARDEWKCTRMEMTVISVRDELIAWYERRGYHRSGRYKPFPYGDERFGIPKRNDLRFELLVKELARRET
jgi:GNAT superfamily N-acetyltransferase